MNVETKATYGEYIVEIVRDDPLFWYWVVYPPDWEQGDCSREGEHALRGMRGYRCTQGIIYPGAANGISPFRWVAKRMAARAAKKHLSGPAGIERYRLTLSRDPEAQA